MLLEFIECYLLSRYRKSHCGFAEFSEFDVLLAPIGRSKICVVPGIRSNFLVFSINYRIVFLRVAFSG